MTPAERLEVAKAELKAQAQDRLAHRMEHFAARKLRPLFWLRIALMARKLRKIEAL